MNNFNLKEFLTENKLTRNSKGLNEENGPFFKATVNFPSKPGVDYGFTVYAKDEEGAKIALADKIGDGGEYSIKNLRGPYTPQAEREEISSRVDMSTIELDGIDSSDYPDFVDAFVASAQFKDGTDLTDDELDQLTDELSDEMHQLAYDYLTEGKTEKEQKLIKEVLKTIKTTNIE